MRMSGTQMNVSTAVIREQALQMTRAKPVLGGECAANQKYHDRPMLECWKSYQMQGTSPGPIEVPV